MNDFDDFDPEGQQQDGSRAIIALLVIMALVLLWGTFLAPKPAAPPPAAEKPEAEKPGTADVPSGTQAPKPPQLTTPTPPKATTSLAQCEVGAAFANG